MKILVKYFKNNFKCAKKFKFLRNFKFYDFYELKFSILKNQTHGKNHKSAIKLICKKSKNPEKIFFQFSLKNPKKKSKNISKCTKFSKK